MPILAEGKNINDIQAEKIRTLSSQEKHCISASMWLSLRRMLETDLRKRNPAFSDLDLKIAVSKRIYWNNLSTLRHLETIQNASNK